MTATTVEIYTVNGLVPAIYIHDDNREFELFIDAWGKVYNNIYEFRFKSGSPIIKI